MNKKFFVINEAVESLPQSDIETIEVGKQLILNTDYTKRKEKSSKVIKEKVPLVYVEGRVIVKVDLKYKNEYAFANGQRISIERNFNEFNKRITQPVNCIVISAENIPTDSEILISHSSIHDSNRIFSYKGLTDTSDIKYYSIKEEECFAWRDTDGEFKPMKNFEFALRVFQPYEGKLEGIEPKLIKDVLYVTTGKLSGQVCHCLIASDYQIVYQELNGRENNLIRFRHSDDEEIEREELIAISHTLTKQVANKQLLIGLSPNDCKN